MTRTLDQARLPLGLGLLLVVCPAPRAQMVWSPKSPALSPPARRLIEHCMVFDSARGRVVLYGGFDGAGGLADTWEWDGVSWLQMPAANPGRLNDHAMAFDSARGRTVLFGGLRTGAGVLSETWEWDGLAWLRRTPARVPPARTGHSMVFDTVRGQVLMFGGLGRLGDPAELNDLWSWDGTDWTPIPTAVGPSRRTSMAMAFDSGRGRAVLFGGFSNNEGILGDTWEWDGVRWQALPTNPLLAGRWRASMAFDPARRRTVLFGGLRGVSLGATWEWDGMAWQRIPGVAPSPRHGAGMAMDTARGRATLFGGGASATDVRRDTWEYQPADVDPPVVTITQPVDGAIAATPVVAVRATVSDTSATRTESAPAGIQEPLPPGGGPITGSVTLAGPDGPQTISLRSTDAVGNVGGRMVSVLLDTTAPQVSIASPAEGAVVGSSPVSFTVLVTDLTATTVRFGGNSIPLPAGGGIATGDVPLLEGSNSIQVLVVDEAGHETPLTRVVRLDLTAPLVTITSPADGARFGQGGNTIPVVASVDDASPTTVTSVPAGVSDSLPAGGGLAVGTVPLQEGMNLIQVIARDAHGRTASASVTVWLDTVRPVVSWSAPAVDSLVRGTIELRVDAQDPAPGLGVERVELTLDGLPLATLEQEPFETMLDTGALADGVHVLRAVAFDMLANQAETMVRIDVDNTAPAVRFLTPAPQAQVAGSMPFELAAADSGSGLAAIEVTAGGLQPSVDASTTWSPPVAADTRRGQEDTLRWPNGPLTLMVRATDLAGNSAEAELTVQVNNALPTLPAITPGEGSRVKGEITITANVPGEEVRRIELFVDGVAIGRSSSSPLRVRFDTRKRLDGDMEIRSVTTGSGGRIATATVHVTVDNMHIRRVTPHVLHLRVPKGRKAMRVEVTGKNVELLAAVPHQRIELRVPGGSPVLAAPLPRHRHDCRGSRDQLQLEFDRRALILAILAGMDADQIPRDARRVTVTLWAAGREIGTAHVHIFGHRHGR